MNIFFFRINKSFLRFQGKFYIIFSQNEYTFFSGRFAQFFYDSGLFLRFEFSQDEYFHVENGIFKDIHREKVRIIRKFCGFLTMNNIRSNIVSYTAAAD